MVSWQAHLASWAVRARFKELLWDGIVPEAGASLDAAAAFILRHVAACTARQVDLHAGAPA